VLNLGFPEVLWFLDKAVRNLPALNLDVIFFKGFHLTHVGHAVAQLVEAPHYKPEGRGFDS